MGKVFITDEVNDMRTAKVTNAGKVKMEDGAANYAVVLSAAATAGKTVVSTACYLKHVIIGQRPTVAASLRIYDTSAGGNSSADGAGVSALSCAFSTSGKCVLNWIYDVSAAGVCAAMAYEWPKVIPINVYMASGIAAEIGDAGIENAGAIGGLRGLTIVYQT